MLVSTTVAIAIVVVPTQVAGVLGAFHRVGTGAAVTATAAVTLWWARRRPATVTAADASPAVRAPRSWYIAFAAAVGGVSSVWVARTVDALDGVTGVESFRYRLPVAARFVQERSVVRLHMVETQIGSLAAYYPHTGELLHAIGMIAAGNEVLSLAINPVAAALLVLGAWCIGLPHGVAPVSATGALVVLAMPDIVQLHPADTSTDVLVAALIVTSAALVMECARRQGPTLLAMAAAGYAAGSAVGVKYTAIASALLLTLAAATTTGRSDRPRAAATWAMALLVGCGPWYLRNLFAVGNPVPPIGLGLGPLVLPSVPDTLPTSSLAIDLVRTSALSTHVAPGLRLAWGPAWWAIVAVLAIAAVLAVTRAADRTARAVGFVAIGSIAAFLLLPQPVDEAGAHVYFAHNVRYALPGVALLLALAPTSRPARGRASWVVGVFVAMVFVVHLDESYWTLRWFGAGYARGSTGPSAAIGLVAGVFASAAVLGARHLRRARGRSGQARLLRCGAVVVGVAAMVWVLTTYDTRRYRELDASGPFGAPTIGATDARIAVVGVRLQYALYGEDLSNHVQYLGDERPDGSFVPIEDCRRWREAVNAGEYDFVVMALDDLALEHPDVRRWARDPSLREVEGSPGVLEVVGALDPTSCP